MDEILRVSEKFPFITLLFVLVYLFIGVGTAAILKDERYRVYVRVCGLLFWPILFGIQGTIIVVEGIWNTLRYTFYVFRD